jgi:hypothetical protein
MARKLSLAQLAKKIGTDKALAVYITAHGELPKGTFSLADIASAAKQIFYLSKIRKQIVAHIVSQTKGSFEQWRAVVEVSRSWVWPTRDDGQIILRHALQQCVNQACSFNHWNTLYDYGYFDFEIIKRDLGTYVLARLVETAQTFGQLEKVLGYGAGKEANLRRKIIAKLKECATRAQWLKVLKGNRDDARQEKRKPICEAAIQELLAQVSGFSEVAEILEALPYRMHSAQKQLIQELAEHAQTRKQWEIVQSRASTRLHLRKVQQKAAEALLPFLHTFNDWRWFSATSKEQAKLRIENMRRLAKTVEQWMELYRFDTPAHEDLEKMMEIGTPANWDSVYISDYSDDTGGLLKARNEALAAYLK